MQPITFYEDLSIFFELSYQDEINRRILSFFGYWNIIRSNVCVFDSMHGRLDKSRKLLTLSSVSRTNIRSFPEKGTVMPSVSVITSFRT